MQRSSRIFDNLCQDLQGPLKIFNKIFKDLWRSSSKSLKILIKNLQGSMKILIKNHQGSLKISQGSLKDTRSFFRLALIAHMIGPIEGCWHDALMLGVSGLPDQLRRFQTPTGEPYVVYGDPDYGLAHKIIGLWWTSIQYRNEQSQAMGRMGL